MLTYQLDCACCILCRYVKVYLLPDKTKNGKRKTRVKKHTLHPIFDEVIKVRQTNTQRSYPAQEPFIIESAYWDRLILIDE